MISILPLAFGLSFLSASLVSCIALAWSRRAVLTQQGIFAYARNITLERSRCDACGTNIESRFLIPVFGFLLSGGSCHHCKSRIPMSVYLPELAVFVAVFGFTILETDSVLDMLQMLAA